MSSNESVPSRNGFEDGGNALHACSSCRRQKKRCDKRLPSCSVCKRLRRACVYDPVPSASAPDSLESLGRRVTELENELREHRELFEGRCESSSSSEIPGDTSGGRNQAAFPGSTTFPSVFFLDVNVFKRRRLKGPRPQMIIQDNIFREIGNDLDIRTTVGAYFFSTATWMSIVSKKQLYQEIPTFPIEMAPDVVLLILCMKLVNDRLSFNVLDPCTRFYTAVKNFFLTVESSGFASIRLLQAGILMCLYETGHAIYPQAYISIGHIGRLGQAIGLHDTDLPQLALEPDSWDEMEERRRVWWAVYNLDRHINIGNPSRSLALAETGRKEYLPVDDRAWEEGVSSAPYIKRVRLLTSVEEMITSEPLFVSSPTNTAAAPFTRLCQASHLLSLVLTHVNDDIFERNVKLEEAEQLSGALLALCSFMQAGFSRDATRINVPMAICYSALILLYYHSSSVGQAEYSQNPDHDLCVFGTDGLHALVPKLDAYAIHIQSILPYNIDQASPLIANCLYRMAGWLSGIPPDTVKDSYPNTLHMMKDTLSKLALRWKVAGEYLQILEDFQLAASANEDMVLDVQPNLQSSALSGA